MYVFENKEVVLKALNCFFYRIKKIYNNDIHHLPVRF